jgi:aspergillopepsin I
VWDNLGPLLNDNLFTADLDWHADGDYMFGIIDSSKFSGDIYYTALDSTAEFWQFPFTKFNVAANSVWYISSWSAIADTGTTLILMPEDINKYYYKEVKGAVFNETYQVWAYPCDTQLPDFNVGFDSGFSVTIPGKYMNYTLLDPTSPSSGCMGGLQPNIGEDFSILGDIFLKSVFAVFDVGNKRIGFAQKPLK